MSTHTPGPWTFRTHHGTDEEQAKVRGLGLDPTHDMQGDGARSVRGPETADEWPTIAHVLPQTRVKRGAAYGHQDAERDANARLIAAAPDLLDALQGLLGHYTALVQSGDCGFWEVEVETVVTDARAAIEKATGGHI